MIKNEYEVSWSIPGLMTNVLTKEIKNHIVEIYYNSGCCNYVLLINSTNKITIYEKHFILTKSEALEIANDFINQKTKNSIKNKVLKFFKKGK